MTIAGVGAFQADREATDLECRPGEAGRPDARHVAEHSDGQRRPPARESGDLCRSDTHAGR